MLQSLKQISILNKIFNVRGNEWSKITNAWLVRFFYRIGFVIGWTVLVAMFVAKYGIAALPYLFILIALFTVLGTFFYSAFLDRFSKEKLMILSIFLSGGVLFAAARVFPYNEVLFFAFLIVAVSVFLMQFKIQADGYIEEMFSPLQSERAFPIIEAADTAAGIIAGLLVMSLSNSFETFRFVYLLLAAQFLIIPFIVWNEYFGGNVLLVEEEKHKKTIGLFTKMKMAFLNAKHISYVKGMFLIVFFQWILYNLLEFQYTKAVFSNVSHVVMDGGSGFEHAFIHSLGGLFILFSGSALFIQLFAGSRLINSLGVFGSMLLHPIITLFSLIGLTGSFNFNTAVLAKNNFTITTVIHTNAYHSAYYGMKENLREHIRELLEGIIRPIGAIIGTLVLILLQHLFIGQNLILSVNLAMIAVALAAGFVAYSQQKKYTDIAINDLLYSNEKKVRFNAIDILGQKGHRSSAHILKRILMNENESVSIRVRALKALGELESIDAINDIFMCLLSKKSAIRSAAIDALECYKIFYKSKALFQKYNLICELKKIYKKERNDEIIMKIIHFMSKLGSVSTVEFLIDVLKNGKGQHKAEAIYALGKYKDYGVLKFLESYLKSKNPKEQINVAIAIYSLKELRDEARHVIFSFLYSHKSVKVICGLFAVGELKLRQKKDVCFRYLNSQNDDLKINSAAALIKMGYQQGIPVLINTLFSGDEAVNTKIKHLLKNLDVHTIKNIDRIVRHIVSEEVEKITRKNEIHSLRDLGADNLLNLRSLYSLVDEYDEVEIIDNIIKN